MGKSISLGTYAGIPVKIHWTFGFLLLFVLYISYTNQLSVVTSFHFLMYIIILFICVTLHEYGHALTARRFGIITNEILLSPIGGIAKMGALSKNPKHELLISIAGPLVNIVIAIIIGLYIHFNQDSQFIPTANDYDNFTNYADLIRLVFIMNIALFVFNLIPAYPMDGGRVLRAIIAFWANYEKATIIASIIGMIIASIFTGYGLYEAHPTLGFIGVFIFISANKERKTAKRTLFLNKNIKPYINKEFTKLYLDQTFNVIPNNSNETNFLVYNESNQIVGSLPNIYIEKAINLGYHQNPISSYMSNNFGTVLHTSSIIEVANFMNERGLYIVGIIKNDHIIGTIDRLTIKTLLN